MLLLTSGSDKPLLLKDDIESVHDNDDDHKGLSKGKKDGPVMYVYSFFHLIFALASMYSAILLTGWGNSSGGADVIDVGSFNVGSLLHIAVHFFPLHLLISCSPSYARS
ncbi:hypothetical protein O6H91_04G003700 [Diphasiastrum complanatum]|uniref:Uncharacterized protein n=2 Tax=Diphasiastrum complanatum TaxID=34168 RepID=A0ACC2DTP9_DIPCM|nr:hypothetical protein O6H91_11G104100 [Diphasiastrum complanatum]KAJ7557644.1 hypothetical protein O6H91_04G003700 [Diphasiastrum complanatum]